jgi:coiled-coil domain-containing protein 40
VVTLEAQVKKEQQEEISLVEKLENCAAIMEQTEIDLKQATQEGLVFEHHLKGLRSKLEKQDKKKFTFEEQILELLQSQITTGIAGDHRGKTLAELQKQRRKLVISMSATESQLSNVLLDLEKWRGQVTRAQESVEETQKHHNEQEAISNKVMDEINMVKSSINAKQRMLDTLNKQLQQLISAAGGQEISPETLRIVDLEKTIAEIDAKIKDMQAFWVRLQSHIVGLSEKRSKQMNGIHIARKQLLVIEQKALKLEHEIENVVADDKEIGRSLATTVGKLELLNGKLFEKRKVHSRDELECELAHQDVTNRLKDAELQVLELEQLLSVIQLDIIDTKDVVMEKHREALSWETKYKLSLEAKKYRDDEMAKTSEIGCMRAEIHRMDVRLAQLKRAQEKLVHDLQNSVHHRSHIFDAASTREKIASSKCKQRSTIHHKLDELKNKIKHINAVSFSYHFFYKSIQFIFLFYRTHSKLIGMCLR